MLLQCFHFTKENDTEYYYYVTFAFPVLLKELREVVPHLLNQRKLLHLQGIVMCETI